MPEKRLIEGYYDEDGLDIHESDIVLYNGEAYVVLSQNDANTPYILHPIGANPHTRDIALTTVNYGFKLIQD